MQFVCVKIKKKHPTMILAAPTFLHAKISGDKRKGFSFESTAQMIHVYPLFKMEQEWES